MSNLVINKVSCLKLLSECFLVHKFNWDYRYESSGLFRFLNTGWIGGAAQWPEKKKKTMWIISILPISYFFFLYFFSFRFTSNTGLDLFTKQRSEEHMSVSQLPLII